MNKKISISPSIGIFVFVVLYLCAVQLYAGGSQANKYATGFDWINNYWCDLMSLNAVNGQLNKARPVAIMAMIILCVSIGLFFVQFSEFAKNRISKFVIRIFGIISMTFAVFISTKYHDLMTIISSLFGIFVVVGIVWEVYKSKLVVFKYGGLFCVLLLGLNNYIYYSNQGINYLPLIQKITFAVILSWIVGLNFKLKKQSNKSLSLPLLR